MVEVIHTLKIIHQHLFSENNKAKINFSEDKFWHPSLQFCMFNIILKSCQISTK